MHEEVSILFTDIVGFTAMSQECMPYQVMQFLHALFLRFDDLCDMDDSLWKVETIGDAVSSKSYHFPQTEKRLQDPISDFIWSLSLSLSLGSSWSQAAWRSERGQARKTRAPDHCRARAPPGSWSLINLTMILRPQRTRRSSLEGLRSGWRRS